MRGWIGLGVLAVVAGAALLALVWTPYDVSRLDVAHRLAAPGGGHLLGTDQLGRDLLSMLMAGAGPSLGTALAGVTLGIAGGVPLGLLAAARPGWVDEGIARIADILFAFPALILALLLVAVLGPGASRAALAIGIFAIPVLARVTRATGRAIWTRDFILAARLAGKGDVRITIDHVLPNIVRPIVVQAGIQLALALVAESGLSYLGLGVQPPAVSWGRMLADGQTLIAVAPRLVLLPGCALIATTLALVWVADALDRRLGR